MFLTPRKRSPRKRSPRRRRPPKVTPIKAARQRVTMNRVALKRSARLMSCECDFFPLSSSSVLFLLLHSLLTTHLPASLPFWFRVNASHLLFLLLFFPPPFPIYFVYFLWEKNTNTLVGTSTVNFCSAKSGNAKCDNLCSVAGAAGVCKENKKTGCVLSPSPPLSSIY